MAKLKNPLLSLKASGSLAKVISFVRRRGVSLVEKRPVPVDAQTAPQVAWRHMFNKCVDLWHLLSVAEKAEWERLATPRHMTGYAWYMSQCLRPNPGIYLPLQGGTMTGDIDMAAAKTVDGKDVSELSRVIWRDVSVGPVADLNRVVTLDWTDLDMTPWTSAIAEFAIIEMRFFYDVVGTGYSNFQVRKNGTAPTYVPIVFLTPGEPQASLKTLNAIIGLDAGQVTEYKITVGAGAQVDSYLNILGYIE